ncbi:MAG: hydroxymethylpyrimidine/phosphomethylpyrimidine kinase [Gammaproteobacteria bacterium]|nr:MAG: hydroxymethylpyrimidine/phosphomethylpyrimidine kinase [Gammaproteobacteria bacterium]
MVWSSNLAGMSGQRPLVLAIAGHDPCGGAGIQADIETIHSLGGRALTLVTLLTAQNTRGLHHSWPVPADLLGAQLDLLLEDLRPAAVKIGLLGSAEQAKLLAGRLARLERPVVLDPVLASGAGQPLADGPLIEALRRHLLPLSTLITPNGPEALRLSGEETLTAAAGRLQTLGARWVLVSGGHGPEGEEVVSRLQGPGGVQEAFRHRRRPGNIHGTGCTLSAAIATLLTRGLAPPEAVRQAHRYTARAVAEAVTPGGGAPIPERLDIEF